MSLMVSYLAILGGVFVTAVVIFFTLRTVKLI
ncbi:MAG: cytochrome b6-f complex subunit PetL [Leptolyngbyaceae cyanobacterium bins.59]|nr:cytochrome b6-f complex subunit PetL [Leptolyngbyaceae cyanobacterium bins.59]